MAKFFSDATVAGWFEHHPPTSDAVIEAHRDIRTGFMTLALQLNSLLPEGPDKSAAMRALRDAMYQANACVAVAQDVYRED